MFTTKAEAGTHYAKVTVRMYTNLSKLSTVRLTKVVHYWPINEQQTLADLTEQVFEGWDHGTLHSVTIHSSTGDHLTITERSTPDGLVYGIKLATNITTLEGGMDDTLTIARIMLANPMYTITRAARA